MVDKDTLLGTLAIHEAKCEDFEAKISKFIPEYTLMIKKKEYTTSEWAFGQLMGLLDIPVRYIKRCPNNLQDKNVNYWLSKTKSKFFLRTMNGEFLRAILSTKYTVVNNSDLIRIMSDIIEKDNVETGIDRYSMDVKYFLVWYYFDIEFDEEKNRIGFMLKNSEVGSHSVELYPFFTLKRRLGVSFIPGFHYKQRHIFTDLDTVSQTLRVNLNKLLKTVPHVIDTFKNSEHIPVDSNEVFEHIKLKYDIRKHEEEAIKNNIRESKSLKEVVEGIATASSYLTDVERIVEVQMIAGKMLDRYKEDGIERTFET